MRTGTKRAIFVALNALLLQLIVAPTNSLSQLYPLNGISLELDGILGSGYDRQEALDTNSNEQPAGELGYLVEEEEDGGLQARETRQVDLDLLQDLVENLRQTDEQRVVAPQLNRHLPSGGLVGEEADTSTSGPVNDPAEFDVSVSQLTNSLNHWIPNTSNRSAFLDGLLSSYLEQQQQLGNEIPHHNNTGGPATTIHQKGSEYIDQLPRQLGHHYMQGGAGEGHQLLGPDGTFENIQVIKTDLAVPSYCDPPNPCPPGYTAADGCLEEFVNSASFSREYQLRQKCSCDNEHSLFNCGEPPSSTIYNNNLDTHSPEEYLKQQEDTQSADQHGKQLETLARAIQNRFGNLASVRNLIDSYSNPVY